MARKIMTRQLVLITGRDYLNTVGNIILSRGKLALAGTGIAKMAHLVAIVQKTLRPTSISLAHAWEQLLEGLPFLLDRVPSALRCQGC